MNTTSDTCTSEPTVFIIDDDRSVLESIVESMRSTGLNIECFSSATEFLTALDDFRPGCVVTDVKMPGMSGLQLQKELAARGNRIPVIMISGHADVLMAVTALRHGAVDFLEKPYAPQQLRDLVLQTVEMNAAQRQERIRQNRVYGLLEQLTEDERRVADGIALGKTAKVLAEELGVSLRTIQFRRSSAMQKLHVSRTELVELVLEARQATAQVNHLA